MNNQIWVVATPLIVWMGVFCYTLIIDRRMRAIENLVGSDDA
ncbi:MAG: CcmD family protein [Chthonomonadales bacterium]|nr:CcmD family protein [Chthonomonadales bacterium]